MVKISALLLLIGSLCAAEANAQDITLGTPGGPGRFGSLVQPTNPMALRSSPPDGIFMTPGNEIGTASPKNAYIITGSKQFNWWNSDRWVQITPVDPDGTLRTDQNGWVRWGEEATSSPNFNSLAIEDKFNDEAYRMILKSLSPKG